MVQSGLKGVLSSKLLVGPRMAVSFGIELHHRFMDGAVEVLRSGEDLVSEVMPLQVAPETLGIVQARWNEAITGALAQATSPVLRHRFCPLTQV